MTNLDQLKNRDYVLVLDKSGSMGERDTPTGQSRWDYAKESVVAIANKVSEYDPDGITLIPFAGTFKVHQNANPGTISSMLAEHSPMGGTTLAPVLKNVFDTYLQNKKDGKTKANGEMLIVITDGQPTDESAVANQIVQFGNKLDNGDAEYGIAFIQVGRDQGATAFLKKLDDDLGKLGAKHDIVDTKTIDEVEQLGLTECLTAALTD